MKTLAWILTAAAVLVGADVFVMSSDSASTEPASATSTTVATGADKPIAMTGGSGIPTPPPDAY
jgi:hypothetical protein